MIKTIAKYSISLGLTGLFLYWAFAGIDLGEVWGVIGELSWTWVGGICAVIMATLVLRAWRWRILMRPFAPQVTLFDASAATCICYAANAVVPRSGEALRALSIKWRYDTPLTALLTTVVVERVLDILTLVIMVGASFGLLQAELNEAFPWLGNIALWALGGCTFFGLVLLGLFLFQDRAAALLLRLLNPLSPRLAGIASHLLQTFLEGLHALRSPAAYSGIIASTVLLNGGYILMIYTAYSAFDFDVKYGLGLEAALVILAVSSIGMVIPTPAGTGTYHKFFGDGLKLLFAVPVVEALACATALHAIGNLMYILLGGIAFLLQRLRLAKTAAVPTPQA